MAGPHYFEDEIATAWKEIESLSQRINADRLALGKHFLRLRDLYSDRQADVRRTLVRGVFEAEIIKRGYKPRTVRE